MKSVLKIVVLVVVVAGLAIFVYGLVDYLNVRESMVNRAVSALGGRTEAERQSIGIMGVGIPRVGRWG